MIRILLSIISYYIGIVVLRSYVQPIREDGPSHHHLKDQIPTMGGCIMIVGALMQFCYKGYLFHPLSIALFGFGLIGLYDDLCKVRYKNTYAGLIPKHKFFLQILLASVALSLSDLDTSILFFGHLIHLGRIYWVFAAFIIVATSNAYNLTDGLDGLAATQGLLLLFGFGVLSIGFKEFVLFEMISALWIMLFGFLWVNAHPAKLFMGDVGSLSIGAVLGLLAILLKVEIAFAIASAVLVFETISVILQVSFFKMGYGRIFKMAPFHHHLELSGWSESQIVWYMAVITLLMLVISTYVV
jgi:phospho-N-acetylmuramoyl-pentapeptide-transferase